MDGELDELVEIVRAGDFARLKQCEDERRGILRRWRGAYGETLLFFATSSVVVKALLESGVDPTIKDHDGRLPHHAYCLADSVDCLEAVLDVIPKCLLDRPTAYGTTALHTCAIMNYPCCAEVLLRGGASTECCDEHGFTALTHAAIGGAHEVASVLMRYGANPYHRTVIGHSCFDFAKNAEDDRMLEVLSGSSG